MHIPALVTAVDLSCPWGACLDAIIILMHQVVLLKECIWEILQRLHGWERDALVMKRRHLDCVGDSLLLVICRISWMLCQIGVNRWPSIKQTSMIHLTDKLRLKVFNLNLFNCSLNWLLREVKLFFLFFSNCVFWQYSSNLMFLVCHIVLNLLDVHLYISAELCGFIPCLLVCWPVEIV